jgi:hypothetical protein
MKERYEESFLFPSSQLDFRRGEIFPAGLLHGLDSVPAGYYARHPDERQMYETMLDQARAGLNNSLSDLAIAQREGDVANASYIQSSIIPSWQFQIDMAIDNLREDVAINVAAQKVVDDINAKSEAAAIAAARAAEQQKAADVFAQAGAEEARQRAQAVADAAAREAAAQQAATDAAKAAATSTIKAVADASDAAARQAAADAAARQAAADAAARQAAADAAARQAAAAGATTAPVTSKQITMLALDADPNGVVYLFGKYSDGSDAVLARGAAAIDAWFKANGVDQGRASKTAAYVKAVSTTQTAAVDTSTGTVQHTDTASGTTTTANTQTGTITKTTATGQTVTGTGKLAVGGVITTVDQNTGVVTTENTRTGVVTQTDSTTGKTVTAVQIVGDSNSSGTFMIPDTGKTVTTTTPITGGTDAGKIALVGLLGLLLLRGAIK